MKWRTLAVCSLLISAAAAAPGKDTGQTVDSGAFGVFVNGNRVHTESFNVQQGPGGSTISAQVKPEGSAAASQSSELRLSPAGDLVRYDWHDLVNKADIVVTPNDQFLIERITTAPGVKPAEQPFLMPASSMVLDNNFFVQREVLIWRYLASACKQENGNTKCATGLAPFGVIVPQDRTSLKVNLEVVGREKVTVKGSPRELLRINLKEERGDWALWVDDQNAFKVLQIVIPGSNTAVVRD